MLTLFLATATWATECESPTAISDVTANLDEAEASFGRLEIPAFLESMDRLSTQTLPCLNEPLEPMLAARVHRAVGLRAFGERDVYAVQAFAAARNLDPDYEFPEDLVAPVSPIREDYTTMSLSAGRTALSPEPKKGALLFDGTETLDRPTAWGTVFQRIDPEGVPQETSYLRPGDPLPEYEAVPRTIGPQITQRRKLFGDAPPGLVAGAFGAAVAGAGLYAAAGLSHSAWENPDAKAADVEAARTRTNALVIGAGAAGVTALGLGVGVAVTW